MVTIGTNSYTGANGQVSSNTKADYYTVAANVGHDTDGDGTNDVTHAFDLTLTPKFLTWLSDQMTNGGTTGASASSATDDVVLYVAYTATLNENALISAANTNHTKLTYGADSSHETATIETDTYCWPFQVYKYTDDNATSTKTPLAGATFKLTDDEAGTGTAYKFALLNEGDTGYNANVPTYRVVPSTTATGDNVNLDLTNPKDAGTTDGAATAHTVSDTITTNATGKFCIQGLDEGIFHLHETVAPTGYNPLAWPVKVVIDSTTDASGTRTPAVTATVSYVGTKTTTDGVASYDATTAVASTGDFAGVIPVENNTGTELPSTGGIGTTIFYVAGTVLVVGAAVMLVAKRRMGAEA